MHCALCGRRRGRRDCPALGQRICPACCGRKRLVEIDCPPDCSWLPGAAGGAWKGRQSDLRRDALRLRPAWSALNQRQAALLSFATAGLVRLRRERRDLDDALLVEALGALRRTAETAESGILYEHRPDDPRAAELVERLRPLFEPVGPEGEPLPFTASDRQAVLAGLVSALEATRAESAGSTAFLDTLTRLEERRLAGSEPAEKPPSRLILPS